jgi:hypothetical protein
MGQTIRTTKLLLDLSGRDHGGTNPGKRAHLTATVEILNAARRFYLDFFLAHPDKLSERVEIISKRTGEVREGVISAENLLTWAEFQTVDTTTVKQRRAMRVLPRTARLGSRVFLFPGDCCMPSLPVTVIRSHKTILGKV